MRNFFDKIVRVFGWMDAVEFAIPAILAALLLVIGPLFTALYFLLTKHYTAAVVSGGLWIVTAVGCIRDLRRRHFSRVSVSLFIAWFITTMILWWRLETL